MLHRRFKFLPQQDPKPDLKIVEPRAEESPDRKEEPHVTRSLGEYDSEAENPEAPARANWTVIWGVVVVAVISVGFWIGVALVVKHYWK